MKAKHLLFLLLGAALAGSALTAQETTTPLRQAQVERRAARQQRRIAQGAASGQLTPRETQHLENREAKLNGDIAKAEADGRITPREQAKLNREENRDSRKIFRKKHNAQVAGQ
jgi:hypothetical protein